MGTITFTSSFIKDAMLKNIQHVDLLPIMGDIQMAFGILTHCFVQCPSYFLQCTPSSSTFIKYFISFDSSLLQMFERLLGLGSFNSPKGPLAHKQACLPITFSGIELISTSTIAPTTYLGNWVFIALVIIVRFMVDQHPFLVEALTQINKNTFPFQQHFKAACDLLPPPTHACFPPFQQLIRQQIV